MDELRFPLLLNELKIIQFLFTHFFRMPFIMKYDVVFNPIKLACFSVVRIMLQTNSIANLFKEFFRRFFHGMISRKILDIMTIGYVIQKKSGYH